MKLAVVAPIVLALSLTAAAQTTVAGKWQGETQNGNQIALDLAIQDGVLSGTVSRNRQPSPIVEGKVIKNTFTFKAKIRDQVEGFSGELAGDELRIWLDREGAESTVVMKRVKDR